jgi:hypothetical protein
MPDRQSWRLPFRLVEVMNMTQNDPASWQAEISSLSDPAARRDAAIGRLDACVGRYQVRPAQAAPTYGLAVSLGAEITFCRDDTGRLAS